MITVWWIGDIINFLRIIIVYIWNKPLEVYK